MSEIIYPEVMKQTILWYLVVATLSFLVFSCSNQQKTSSVQPVKEESVASTEVDNVAMPEEEIVEEKQFTIEAVDLGLSVLWANANIGANSIYDVGEYYAWGESSPKSSYMLDNYFDYYIEVKDGGYVYRGYKIFTKNGQSLIGTEYDTANNIMGSGWRMPTSDEYNELKKFCSTRIDCLRDRNGNPLKDGRGNFELEYVQLKAPNGNTIIFPYGGYKRADSHDSKDCFFYWTANINNRGSDNIEPMAARLQDYTRGTIMEVPMNRGFGMNIRAVKDREASSAMIADGEYSMEGRVGTLQIRDFVLVINGSNVTGKYLNSDPNICVYFDLEGTKDEHNNIKLKETWNGRDMGHMEGVFDGISFRGKDYDVEGIGRPFKVLVKK